jgi:glycine betaine/proline transport system substrate-binding protein
MLVSRTIGAFITKGENMRSSKKLLVVGLVAVGSLIGAACGGSDTASDTTEAATDGCAAPELNLDATGTETIKIARNNWSASAVEVEIVKQLIETNLGNPVEIVDIDENAMFAGMSSGDIDASVEVWPSGVVADEQAFIDDCSVTNMGDLGAVGKIGWFVSDYALTQFPQLSSWEGLKDPEVAKAFATAATGDNGRFLGMDPSFSQYDEAIIANLGLPFQVQFSGSEAATQAEITALSAEQKPVLLYYWSPSGAVGKYNLKNIALPAPTVDCALDGAKCDGDYPEDPIFKIASTKLAAKDGKVFNFFQKFTLTTDDQLSFLGPVDIDKVDPAQAASDWIAANEATWSTWFN